MDESKRYGFWKEQFEEVFSGENIDPRELYEKALPCFYEKYDLKEKKDISVIGTTRQGGFPDLPESENWPVENGKAMSFLAQINLGELEPDFAPYLPAQGWLYFFMGEFQNWVSIPHRILYFDGPVSQLKQTSPPEDSTLLRKFINPTQYPICQGLLYMAKSWILSLINIFHLEIIPKIFLIISKERLVA